MDNKRKILILIVAALLVLTSVFAPLLSLVEDHTGHDHAQAITSALEA